MAMAVSLFLLPNELSSGGFSGIATIIYYLFKVPMGTTILALNIPLFLFFRREDNAMLSGRMKIHRGEKEKERKCIAFFFFEYY